MSWKVFLLLLGNNLLDGLEFDGRSKVFGVLLKYLGFLESDINIFSTTFT